MRRRCREPRRIALAGVLLAVAGVVVAGPWGPARAQDAASEHAAAAPVAPTAVATDAPPPFWVAGVVIGPARRSAILVALDDARREIGLITLHEGESYNGHRVAAVEPARVLLEREGKVFALVVGRPYDGPRGTSDAAPRASAGPIFVPGPDKPTPDVEYTGPQVPRGQSTAASSGAAESQPSAEAVGNFLERVFGHPQMRQQLEEIRPIVRQRMDRARQDGQAPAPAATSTPADRGPR
jgi:hypothetical protein